MRRKTTTEPVINGNPIRAEVGYPVIVNIIEGIQKQLDYMRRKYAQVIYVSSVVKYPMDCQPWNPTGDISQAMRKFHQKAERENIECMTTWILEYSSFMHPHFNIIILGDGTKSQSGYRFHSWLDSIWSRMLNLSPNSGYVHLNQNDPEFFPPAAILGLRPSNELRIRRGSPEEEVIVDNVINAASYYAKTNTKELIPPGCRSFGSSRIPQKLGGKI